MANVTAGSDGGAGMARLGVVRSAIESLLPYFEFRSAAIVDDLRLAKKGLFKQYLAQQRAYQEAMRAFTNAFSVRVQTETARLHLTVDPSNMAVFGQLKDQLEEWRVANEPKAPWRRSLLSQEALESLWKVRRPVRTIGVAYRQLTDVT